MLYDAVGRVVGKLAIGDGSQVVTVAGTRQGLSATSLVVNSLAITAKIGNTGVMVVGGVTVVAATATRQGTPLDKGDTLTMSVVDLADVYIDATISGEGVTYTYLRRA